MGLVSSQTVSVAPLSRISVPGGDVLHALKQSDDSFAGFGEAYFSWVDEKAIKAWKCHTKMTMNLIVPVGQVRFVFYFEEKDEFRVEEIGVDRFARITVKPGIWFGFQGLRNPSSLVLNVASIPHDPMEGRRKEIDDIYYDWNLK
jgi:dTDP-4-dehydrorhamnose 3,5-epimerase